MSTSNVIQNGGEGSIAYVRVPDPEDTQNTRNIRKIAFEALWWGAAASGTGTAIAGLVKDLNVTDLSIGLSLLLICWVAAKWQKYNAEQQARSLPPL